MTCLELMTPMPTCCQGEHTLADVATMMKRDNVGAIPVTEGDAMTLVGLITDRDIVVKAIAEGMNPASTAVSAIMSTDLVCCKQDDSSDRALDLMATNQIRRIPVVNDRGELVGIIAQADVATRLPADDAGQMVVAFSTDTDERR